MSKSPSELTPPNRKRSDAAARSKRSGPARGDDEARQTRGNRHARRPESEDEGATPEEIDGPPDEVTETPALGLKRWLHRAQVVTGVIVVIAASVLVAWGLRRYLYQSPRFAVRAVTVGGNQRLSAHEIAESAGIAPGMNIFSVHEDRAQAAVLANPWIESAQVRKDLPDDVRITVTEREARLLVNLDGQLYLADGSGHIFKELGPGDPSDLPIITGLDPERVGRDREGARLSLRRAIDLLADLEREKIAERRPVQEVRIDEEGSLSAVVGTDAVVLKLGPPPYRLKVQKARRIFAELHYRKVVPDVLFLDNTAHPERVVVRMRANQKAREGDG